MANVTPINRLLVANRGEIARRIMRTAREMGITTIAVYADGDRDAPFVTEADYAYSLAGRTSTETYLETDKIIEACRRSGADALHPGYGFLSENAGFAQAVVNAGLRWIGPSPQVIAAMGDKLSAKALMQEAGVPTLPAIRLDKDTDLSAAADSIGYPVLVKASAGGGGRGMRVVESASALADAVASARREAGSSFGDDTVFLEKWLDKSRHVEIQIIGDTYGHLVHCFERECSIQRRHQKIIEEAPSPALDPATRNAMGEAALLAAGTLGYSSAGTVEFLLSGSEFYFLEVNARLQVEHPVTEAIIGKDLVREQIRIAEGEPLSFRQEELEINGHAIEARLCAEDPGNDFLPSPGTVVVWEPSTQISARFDSGVESGSVISTEFDAMIAKVIVHAPTRREAAARLARVLETTRIQGLTTNRDFLVATLRHDAFIRADTTTDFISRVAPARTREISEAEFNEAAIAAAMASQARNRRQAKVLTGVRSGWRNSTLPFEMIRFRLENRECQVEYRSRRDGCFQVRTASDGPLLIVSVTDNGQGKTDIVIDGKRVTYHVQSIAMQWLVHGPAGDLAFTELARYPAPDSADNSGGLVAPMPGAVLATEVAVGSAVRKGDLLLILEAMKMEHRITAPMDGTVTALHVSQGQQVINGQLLVTIDDNASEDKEETKT